MRFGGFNPSTNKINEEQEDFDEEIYVSNKIVVWSRGNVLYKSFKYDEPVIQALFVWFKVDQRQQSNNYTTTSTNNNNNHNKDLSGRQRCLFVILENSAKVYFLDGQQFLLRIPFVVKKAWAMNLGVLFQCQHKDIDENDDYYHYHTRDYINYSKFAKLHLPTLYSLLDPLEEIKPVSIVDKIYYDGSNIKLSGHKFLFTYPDEHIVFVNDQCENGNHIIVTLNQFTLRHSFILDNSEPCIEENENEEEHNSKVFIAHEFDALNLISNNFSSDGSCYELEITPNFELNNVIAAEPVYATRSLLCDVLLLKKINDDSYMLELWIGCGEYVLLQLDYHLNTILKLNSNSSKIKNLNSTSILNHSEINNCVDSLANTNINSVIDPSIENFVDLNYKVNLNITTKDIIDIQDNVLHRVNIVLNNHVCLRADLNFIPNSLLVRNCLEALSYALPTKIFFIFKARYLTYQFRRFDTNSSSLKENNTEWENFIKELDGWDFLLSTTDHKKFNFNTHFKCLKPPPTSPSTPQLKSTQEKDIEIDDLLYKLFQKSRKLHFSNSHQQQKIEQLEQSFPDFLPYILLSLHLIYQDMRLDVLSQKLINDLVPLLIQLALFLEVIKETKIQPTHLFYTPPDIIKWLMNLFRSKKFKYFPSPIDITKLLSSALLDLQQNNDCDYDDDVNNMVHEVDCCLRTRQIIKIYNKLINGSNNGGVESMILKMVDIGFKHKDIEALPFGVSVPLHEAIRKCRELPPSNWPADAYILIGREDLAELELGKPIGYIHSRGVRREPKPRYQAEIIDTVLHPRPGVSLDEVDSTEISNHEITDLRFGKDKRLDEVRRLLQNTTIVKVDLPASELSSPNEEQSPQIVERVQAHSIKNFALPLGRGIMTYDTATPISTEIFPIPSLNTTMKVLPYNTVVQIDRAFRVQDCLEWPEFHEGVASALRISPTSKDVTGSWIELNKPKELNNSHAGFLMGLGINGHLKSMGIWQAVDYLMKSPKHDMTNIALVIGLPASYCGTMNSDITRMLAVHITSMLPPKSNYLNVSPLIQTASLIGIGLLYMGTCNRYNTQIMLSEIGVKALKRSNSSETDYTEGYSLAAGFALGFIALGQGDDAHGIADLNLSRELRLYITGGASSGANGKGGSGENNGDNYIGGGALATGLGGKLTATSSSSSTSSTEGSNLGSTNNVNNINVTSPSATIALGLLYLKTNKLNIANKIPIPETEFYLDYIRPDFLLVRILARNLIMWDNIRSSQNWVENHVPKYMKVRLNNRSHYQNDDFDLNLEPIKRAYYNILAGACFSMALKFAGSTDQNALKCLIHYLDYFIGLSNSRAMTFDQKITKSTIKSCLNVLATSTSIVVAGTGNLDVLRRLRKLHRQEVNLPGAHNLNSYGTYTVTSMALGFLFLGGGHYTLSTSNKAIAALVCSLFPRYPIEPYDNRAHLQAFRHLWVLAVEPRCLVLRDLETREACQAPIKIIFEDYYNSKEVKLTKEKSRGAGENNIIVSKEKEVISNIVADIKIKEFVAPCLLPESKFIKTIEINSPRYWPINLNFESELSSFCTAILTECLYLDNPEAIQMYLALYQIQQNLEHLNESNLCNAILILEYYKNAKNISSSKKINTIDGDIIASNRIDSNGGKDDYNEEVGDDKRLINKEFEASLKLKLKQFFEIPFTFFLSPLQLIKCYLSNSEFPSNEELGGNENKKQLLRQLSLWLNYNEIPDHYTISTSLISFFSFNC
ncbi:63_t:CDS:10 [Entrophospora sp. SA101]|nr:63_t:CDS:10 [Entrophospora sp. SA101]